MHNNFYICFTNKNKLDNVKVELAFKYWNINHNSRPIRHTYHIYELKNLFGYKSSNKLRQDILSFATPVFNDNSMKCPQCGMPHKAKDRTELKRLSRQRKISLCNKCRTKYLNKELTQLIENFKYTLEPLIFFEENYKTIQNLTYITKVTLLALILNEDFIEESRFVLITKRDISGSEHFNKRILREIIDAELITEFSTNYCQKLIKRGLKLINSDKKLLNPQLVLEFHSYIRKSPKDGVNIMLTPEFKTMIDFVENLKQDLDNYSPSITDLQDLEELVVSNKLELAYVLLNYIKEQHNIPIETNPKLDSVLTKLVREYSMKQAFYIMNHKAILTAATLYSNKAIPHFTQQRILCKKIESHMFFLENKYKEPYEKKLPDGVRATESYIEYFFNKYILDETINWNSLSGNEIISRWVNSIKMENLNF